MTKENLKKIAHKISTSRKKKESQAQGKGKHKIILPKESENEQELLASVVDILEDASINKVYVKTQFKHFIELEEKQGRSKKVIFSIPSKLYPIDLVSTPPPPSPTQIIQEDIPVSTNISPVDLCKSAMLKTLKEKVDKDIDLQQFINKLPYLFLKA